MSSMASRREKRGLSARVFSWLERYAVICEEVAVLRCVRVFITVISEAVTDVQQTVLRKCDRYARREIAQPIFATKPIGNNAGFRMDGLLVSNNCSGSRLVYKAGRTTRGIPVCPKHTVRTGSKPWAVIAGLNFLADVRIDVTPTVLGIPLVQGSVPHNSCCYRDPLVIVVVVLPFEIGLDISESARISAARIMRSRKIHARFCIRSDTNHESWIVNGVSAGIEAWGLS